MFLAIACSPGDRRAPDPSAPDAGALDAGTLDASAPEPIGPLGDDVASPESATTRAAPGMPLAFEPLFLPSGEVASTGAPRWRLIKTAQAFSAALSSTPPPTIDFSRSWVVWYAPGTEGAAGTRASIQRLVLRGNRLDITTTLETAQSGCDTAPEFDRTATMVIFDKALIEAQVENHRFLRADGTRDCGLLSRQARHRDELAAFFDTMAGMNGWVLDFPVDRASTLRLAHRLLLDGTADESFYRAVRSIGLAFPVGHAGVLELEATTQVWPSIHSRWGVCARPSGASAVITHVTPGNVLGLRPGDAIVQVNNEAVPAMFETALRRSISGASSASASHRRTLGAVSLFAGLPEGSQLVVVAPDGARRTVNAPARVPNERLDCTDPMGREYLFEVRATIRPDGIGVIRLPGFSLHNPPPNTTFEERRSLLRGMILDAFNQVKSAPGIVWDLRANGGGMTPVAYDIMAGMPGTSAVATHTCKARVPMVEPPTFQAPFTQSTFEPGGPFVYSGKIAVVIDGLAASAGDYFALALRATTDVPLVGTPGAGAFGGGGAPAIDISADPKMVGFGDIFHCADAQGVALEGRATQPTHFVEMSATDLAAGIDTQLEAAVRLVR